MFTNALFTAAVACGLLASSVNAHMVITSPVPYGVDSLNNSPLEADGSDFPCKQRAGVYDMGTMNNMAIGVPQQLAFKGGATHGGGSCQISITPDEKPTKDSTWKVIYSIIGSCPNGDAGNANGSPDYTKNPTFNFSVPKGVPNGRYTLAWTWFNKIGNREMYMNCAPITVTGGTSKHDGASSALDSFPDMFVANIGNGCGTTESEDYVFPQPGQYVTTVAKTALGTSTTGTCHTAAAAGGSGSGSGSSDATPTASYGSGSGSGSDASAPAYGASSAAAAPTSAASAPAYSPPAEQGSASDASGSGSSGGMLTLTTLATVTATGASPGAAQATGYSNSSSSSGADSSSSSSASASSNSNSTSSGSCSGGAVSCSTDGAVICIGSDQWGLCNAGCAVPASLASGTQCANGVIAKRADIARHLRRHLYHERKI